MAEIYVLPPLPCAPNVATSSGRSDEAAECNRSKSRFQLSSTYPTFVNITSVHLMSIIPISSYHQETSLLSISQSLSKTNLSADLHDYPLSVSMSIPLTVTLVLVVVKLLLDYQRNRYHASGTYDLWFRFFRIGNNI